MARFDEVFAELQAKMASAIAVIAQYPEVAAEVKAAIDAAQNEAEIVEAQAQDDARANALATVITDIRAVLAEVPAPETPVVPE